LKNLVTGGAGFLGSHLIDRLMGKGEFVYCLDNFLTGNYSNIEHWVGNKNFKVINHDITKPIFLEVEKIWHLACPASPKQYQKNPINTTKISFLGTLNMLDLAKNNNSEFLLASTSEVYGDPEINPQPETYKGCVNPIGIRSCYDEGKRIAESLSFDYHRMYDLNIHIVRIFNTFGPRMSPSDGRVISNFICQALENKPITVYGKGNHTRSFCYVEDLINGMIDLMESNLKGPVNIGNPEEISVSNLAQLIKKRLNSESEIIYGQLPKDDPSRRKPDITLATKELNWQPRISFEEGLEITTNYFKNAFGK
jgi:UDP-glucuronate decarboxylase